MVVLDLGLPGMSGMSLLAHLRAQGNPVPVLVVTAKDTTADRIAGLDAGADDYLGKPFDLGEVVSRCRALVRRSQNRASEPLVRGRSRRESGVDDRDEEQGARPAYLARIWRAGASPLSCRGAAAEVQNRREHLWVG